jgi:PAS domain S-box-containing protein
VRNPADGGTGTTHEPAGAALGGDSASLAVALEAVPETVALYRPVLDDAGRFVDAEIVFANETCRRSWLDGVPLEEVRGRRLFEQWPRLRPLIFDAYAATVESGIPFRGRRETPTATGRTVFDVAITPYEGGLVHVARDVTEEEQAVAALRASEEQLRRTIEGVDAIVGFQEHADAPLMLGGSLERILGYRPEQLRDNAAWNALIHPDDLPACLSYWEGDAASWKLEYRVRRSDGTWIWVGDRGRRMPAGEGHGPGMFGVVVEITAQHDAAQRVRESETRFRAVFEENPETIGVCRPILDEHGRFLDAELVMANRVTRERYLGGVPAGAVSGSAMFATWPHLREPLFEAAAAVSERGEPFRGEYHGVRGGADFWSDLALFPFEGGFAFVGRDVTERKVAELALRESEARYRAVTDSAVDAIVTIDGDGVVVACNPSAERMFGFAPHDLVGRSVTSLMPEVFVSGQVAALERFRHGDEMPPMSQARGMRGRRQDGSEFPVEISLADWSVSDARFATAIIRDVSRRMQAEEDLRVASARLRRFFEANIVGTTVGEVGGRLLEANDYWLRLLGFSRDELERGEVDWRAVTAPASQAIDDRAIAELRERGTTTPYEKEYRRRDGTFVPVLIVRATMPGPGEQIASFVLDMTERRADAAGMARLAAAIEQTSESVLVTDLEARIVYANPAFERVSGYTLAEVLGQNPRILQGGAQPPALYAAMWAALTAGETWRGELVNRRRDGTRFTEEASISPIRDETGAITAYVAVKRDITAQRDLEAQLRQAQRLEAVGQLAGGVAHDFNNLLAAIRGYGELAQASLAPGSQGRDDIDEVLRAADRATTLTRQLLAFSRRQVLAATVLDPSAVVEELLPMLRRLLGEHIELVTSHGCDLGMVKVDPGQLEQVVVNLAVNARDAMPAGGRLSIATENVELEPIEDAEGLEAAGTLDAPHGSCVRITVSDSGTGMSEATRARIFEPFFTTKEPGRGTGMGLATVYGIVRQSGGRISATSTLGRGSSFVIDLPRVSAAAEDQPAPAQVAPAQVALPQPPAPDGAGRRILLVEDDEAVLTLLGRVLSRLGYRVIEAASGDEALERVAADTEGLDLLVTDVRMPGIQGPELARRLRSVRPDLPVLFISAFSEELGVSPDALPGLHVLDKPFDAETFGRAIRTALAGKP